MTDKYITTCCQLIFYGANHSPQLGYTGYCRNCGSYKYGDKRIESESQLRRFKVQRGEE